MPLQTTKNVENERNKTNESDSKNRTRRNIQKPKRRLLQVHKDNRQQYKRNETHRRRLDAGSTRDKNVSERNDRVGSLDKRPVGRMRLKNEQQQKIYYNTVEKNGKVQYIIKSITGHPIIGRDGQKKLSRTFTREYQAEKWLNIHGYTAD